MKVDMGKSAQDPYKTPVAELVAASEGNGSILKLKRFSAWGVFGLGLITLGIYPLYWLYSRSIDVSSLHEKPISRVLLNAFLLTYILSFAVDLMGDGDMAAISSLVIFIVYLILYLTVLFTLRSRLQDVMYVSSGTIYKLNIVLAFFLSAIYLQYKINQCIDECSGESQ